MPDRVDYFDARPVTLPPENKVIGRLARPVPDGLRRWRRKFGGVELNRVGLANSAGFWCPLSYLAYTGYDISKLKLGDEFDTLNDHKICQKYYTPATLRAMQKSPKRTTLIDYQLPQHYDTEQLRYNLHKIMEGDLLTLTEKCHGTSTRVGNVPVTRPVKLPFWKRLWNRLPFPKYADSTTQYEFVVGTRRTIASERFTPGDADYYRLELAPPLDGMLLPGEIIYAEIVGYDSNGKLIMNPQSTAKLQDKGIKSRYGPMMQYTYGCAWNDLHKPQRKMLVYRITHLNPSGLETDLSWQQIKGRCAQLGLETVPEIPGYVNNNVEFYGDSQEEYVNLLLSDIEGKELETDAHRMK